jgi:protein-tyrosine phosphatase
MSFQNILIVCIGNICRSPMAEALFKQACPDKNISSAGLEGLEGHNADFHAIECMHEMGLDISTHIARRLDADMLTGADLVLAMTSQHVKIIEERWGFSKGKVFRLCHWSDQSVADPYQKGKLEFTEAKELIEMGVKDWVLRL